MHFSPKNTRTSERQEHHECKEMNRNKPFWLPSNLLWYPYLSTCRQCKAQTLTPVFVVCRDWTSLRKMHLSVGFFFGSEIHAINLKKVVLQFASQDIPPDIWRVNLWTVTMAKESSLPLHENDDGKPSCVLGVSFYANHSSNNRYLKWCLCCVCLLPICESFLADPLWLDQRAKASHSAKRSSQMFISTNSVIIFSKDDL